MCICVRGIWHDCVEVRCIRQSCALIIGAKSAPLGARHYNHLLQELRDNFDIDVRVLGLASSQKMLLSDAALDLATWREQYDL